MNFEGARYHRCKGILKENCLLYYTCKNRRLVEMQKKYNRGCDGVVKFRVVLADGEFKANVDHLIEFRPHDEFCEYFETNMRLRAVCKNELGKEKSRQGQKSKKVREQQISTRPVEDASEGNLQAIQNQRFENGPRSPNKQAITNGPKIIEPQRAPDRHTVANRQRPSAKQLFANNFKINRVVFVSGSESDDDDYPKNHHRQRFSATDKSNKPYVTPVYEIVQDGDEGAPINFFSKLTGSSPYEEPGQTPTAAKKRISAFDPMDSSSSFSDQTDELSNSFDKAGQSFSFTKRPPAVHRAERTFEAPNQPELLFDSFSKRPKPINPIPPEKRTKRSASTENEPPQNGELIKHKYFDLVQKDDGSIVIYA